MESAESETVPYESKGRKGHLIKQDILKASVENRVALIRTLGKLNHISYFMVQGPSYFFPHSVESCFVDLVVSNGVIF